MIPGGLTPTQFGKRLVLEHGEGAHWWSERVDPDDLAKVTDLQHVAIDTAVAKHWQRVRRFLGLELTGGHADD